MDVFPGVGVTALDGGKENKYLYEILGEKEFEKLISSVFT